MARRAWPIVGQQSALDFFDRALDYEQSSPGGLGGSFILSGPASSGKTAVLEAFLGFLSPSGEQTASTVDIVRLEKAEDKREIGIAQARDFSGRLALSSFGGRYRIGVIEGAEALSIEAANALLKTLEDARDQVLIFMLATSADHLPATIRSRSQLVNFKTVPSDAIYEWLIAMHGVARAQAKNIARLSNGRPGLALRLASEKKLLDSRLEPVKILCTGFSGGLHERWQMIAKHLGSATGAEAAEKALETIQSWRLGLRDLMLLLLNRPELVVHAAAEEELRLAAKRVNMSELRRFDDLLRRSVEYIRSNVNPKLALEQAIMNIH